MVVYISRAISGECETGLLGELSHEYETNFAVKNDI